MPLLNAIRRKALLIRYFANSLIRRKQNFSTNSQIAKWRNGGFTLIELLTVITIIGILVTIAVASYSTAQTKGRDSRRKTDLDTIKKALELAKIDSPGQYYYPNCTSGAGTTCEATQTIPALSPTYTPNVPVDIKTKNGYTYAPTGCTSSGCPDYTLTTCLENKNDPQKDSTNDTIACPNSGLTAGTVSFTIKPN